MSTERKRSTDVDFSTISEDDAARFLRSHADFFERHPDLLARLKLPHDPGDNTVSLIERQVAILRERNRKLDQKLRELIGLARVNDVLAKKIHHLSMRLMGTTDLPEILQTLESVLHDELGSDQSVLMLFRSDTVSKELSTPFIRYLTRKEPGLDLFKTFLTTGRPRCGQIGGVKREFLFGDAGTDIESAVLIPLGNKAEMGFLAIGSNDASRFHPGMSTDFLVRLGELIERGIGCAN